MRERFPIWLFATAGLNTLVLALSGGWGNPWLWAYCVVWSATVTYGVLGIDADLARERFNPPTRGADRAALGFIRLLGLTHLVVGALDAGRWHLTVPVPSTIRGAALVGMGISMWVVFRSMHENRYFSSVVRVQHDRGHQVVETGPYALVRHPGYAGMLAAMPFSGLAMGSWVGFAVALGYSVLIIRRVLFEDAFLQRHLNGYTAYAQRVTHRLIPGTW